MDLATQTYKTTLSTAVVKAFARTGKDCSHESVNLITSDVIDEYNDLPIEIIIEALKKGGRGKYGRTYLLSVQEVFIWIDSYLKENPDLTMTNEYIYFRWMNDNLSIVRRVLKTESKELFESQARGGYTPKFIKSIKNKTKTWN